MHLKILSVSFLQALIAGASLAASQLIFPQAWGLLAHSAMGQAEAAAEKSAAISSATANTSAAGQIASSSFDQTYALFGRELAKYLENGNVHYKRWKENPAGLDQFLKSLSDLPKQDYERFSPEQKKAFWLNAYNAITIKVVLDNYPIKGSQSQYPPSSFRQIPGEWENGKFKIMGAPVTLYEIEHEKLRHELPDPRLHFAVVCASRSCAKLSPAPFVAENIDQRLDQCTQDFFADPKNLTVNPRTGVMSVNKIFSWFTLDFAGKAGYAKRSFPPPMDEDIIASYVSFYVPTDERDVIAKFRSQDKLVLDYLPYDWALNDADETK